LKHGPRRPGWLYGLVGAMVLFWSLNYVISKLALRVFPPPLLVCLRTTLAGLLMAPVYWWDGRGGRHRWHWREAPGLLALGVVGSTVNQMFFVLGIARTSVAHAAFLIGLSPIIVLLVAGARGQEHLTARKIAGIVVALCGVVVIQVWRTVPDQGAGPSILGDLLIVCSSLAFSFFTVAGKEVTRTHGTITVNTFAYVGGALLLMPYTLWKSASFDYAAVGSAGWAYVIYMALFPSVVCYLIFYYALSWLPASRMSMLNYLQPPMATALSFFLLGEPVTAPMLTGGALVLGGVFLAGRSG